MASSAIQKQNKNTKTTNEKTPANQQQKKQHYPELANPALDDI
jgi:hypothetical protein